MFKDNKDFYPTPKSLIDKMLSEVDLAKIKTILEPSAGKGNIVEEIISKGENYGVEYKNSFYKQSLKFDIDCIELDANLRYILQGKGYRVVHDDFLTYETYKKYDLIIANYPFSEGDKHMMKSLDLIKNGGQLVCLINAETIRNPYSNIRKDLIRKLEEVNAKIEYLQDEFIDAERKTNVEIALIKVNIENKKNNSIILDKLKQEEQHQKKQNSYGSNSLIDGDFINGIVQQYQFELKAGINLINEYYSLQPLMLKSFDKTQIGKDSMLKLTINDYEHNKAGIEPDVETLINDYIKSTRYKYWKALFENPQFTNLLTSNLLDEYREKVNELKNYDFSLFNIKEIQKQMSVNLVKGVEDTILDLFDEFSSRHHYAEYSKNIHYYNGWKTNSAYKINKKVIIPLNGWSTWSGSLDLTYKFYEKIKDIEHVFDYLDDCQTEHVELKNTLILAQDTLQTKNIETKYFTINIYKKGTTHLIFKNEELLKKFNIFGSCKKGWLPDSYGKKQYNDMTDEEKTVINNFEGEEEYSKTMNNTSYYLYNPTDILMLN